MSVASTSSRMCAIISSRLTEPSAIPRENAKPADVVAIALNPRCSKYFAVPMSHGFGIAKQPLSCSRRNSLRFSSIVAMAQCRERPTGSKSKTESAVKTNVGPIFNSRLEVYICLMQDHGDSSHAFRSYRTTQTRGHHVHRHGGLQDAGAAQRQACAGIVGGTPPTAPRNLSPLQRHRDQNDR